MTSLLFSGCSDGWRLLTSMWSSFHAGFRVFSITSVLARKWKAPLWPLYRFEYYKRERKCLVTWNMTRKGSDLRVSPLGRPHAFSWRCSCRFFVSIEDPSPRLPINCQQFCLACLIWAGRPLTVSPEFDWNANIFREFSLSQTIRRINGSHYLRQTETRWHNCFDSTIMSHTSYMLSIFQDILNQTNKSLTWSELNIVQDILFQCDKCLSTHIGW